MHRLAIALPFLLAACATPQIAPVPASDSEHAPAAFTDPKAPDQRGFDISLNPDPHAPLGETFIVEWE